jgi:glyoxylase-like metal-dependent hydrolase (beta-lactamase superfamily II)
MDNRIECVVVGPIETNCWLYAFDEEQDGKRPCIVIDPGDEAAKIISSLRKLNWIPRYVFMTHGHWDHINALPDLLGAFRNGVFAGEEPPKIYIHGMDAHCLKADDLSVHHFEEGDTIGPFKIFHIPGHTQGCVGFYDEKSGNLFTGDTLFQGDYGRTDLPGGSEDEIHKSLKRLLSLKGETVVYPGHGPTTTVEEEKPNFPGS